MNTPLSSQIARAAKRQGKIQTEIERLQLLVGDPIETESFPGALDAMRVGAPVAVNGHQPEPVLPSCLCVAVNVSHEGHIIEVSE